MLKQGMTIQTRKGGRYEVGSDDEASQVNIDKPEEDRKLKNPKSKIPNPNEIPNPNSSKLKAQSSKEEDAKGFSDAA